CAEINEVSISWTMEYPHTAGSSPNRTTTASPNRRTPSRSHSRRVNDSIASRSRMSDGSHSEISTHDESPHASDSRYSERVTDVTGFIAISLLRRLQDRAYLRVRHPCGKNFGSSCVSGGLFQ